MCGPMLLRAPGKFASAHAAEVPERKFKKYQFSKVSALLHLLYTATTESTSENFATPRQRVCATKTISKKKREFRTTATARLRYKQPAAEREGARRVRWPHPPTRPTQHSPRRTERTLPPLPSRTRPHPHGLRPARDTEHILQRGGAWRWRS